VKKLLTREQAGMLVREVWLVWAAKQPDVHEHPSWLTSWEDLPELIIETIAGIGLYKGCTVVSRDGTFRGEIMTGNRLQCTQVEGCTLPAYKVVWADGAVSTCCRDGLEPLLDGSWRLR